jgi:plastocyanin
MSRNVGRFQQQGRCGRIRRGGGARLMAFSAIVLLTACSGAQQADEAESAPPAAEASEPVAAASSPAATSAASEAADVTVSGVDYAFQVPEISAGDTIGFVNESDKEFHEMVVERVTDDSITLEDIQQALQQGEEGSEPTWVENVGHTFAAPGETGAPVGTPLDAGRYLFLCFVPQNAPPDVMAQLFAGEDLPSEQIADVMSGPPHAAVGMVELVEVE